MNNSHKDIKKGLTPKIIALLIIGSVLFMFSVIYIANDNYQDSKKKSLEMISKAYADSINSFREFYTKTILDKIHGSNVKVSHNYYKAENTIPIPATMTIDLIGFLNMKSQNANLRLISEYPYPWRDSRSINSFDKEALDYFNHTSINKFSKLYEKNENDIFEYAVPIKMSKNCVQCHNTHPDSPKTDWKIGDIRGIQVVSIQPNAIGANQAKDQIYFIIAIILFFAFNMSVILWLLQKNKVALNLIEKDKKNLTNALEEAKAANKAKSDFVANISHEIRTPLNAIIGFADILKDSKLPDKEKNQISIISKSGKSLLLIINEILDYSKMESGKFEINPEIDSMKRVLLDTKQLFEARASEKNITIHDNIDEEIPPYLVFDSVRIQQVVSNILSNAIKFTPEKGNIWLIAKVIENKENEVKLFFEIKDDGIGIPKDKQKTIFEEFSQADNSVSKKYGGTGLGLTIISKILLLMNSKIKLKSKDGKGSSFSFKISFPIAEEENHNLKTNIIENQKLSGNILIAEDNEINRILIESILSEKFSLSPKFAFDGNEAIKMFKENTFDLIFMDINMPNCDGIEATKNIRQYEKNNILNETPIIALTANAVKGDKEKFLSYGMNEYLSKPLVIEELKKVLKTYLSETIKQNQNSDSIEHKVSKEEKINPSKIAVKLGISESIAKLIINKFEKDIQKDIQELKDLIDNKDDKSIIQKAHYIKNSCLNVCLDNASLILQKLEEKNLSYEDKEKLLKEICILLEVDLD